MFRYASNADVPEGREERMGCVARMQGGGRARVGSQWSADSAQFAQLGDTRLQAAECSAVQTRTAAISPSARWVSSTIGIAPPVTSLVSRWASVYLLSAR